MQQAIGVVRRQTAHPCLPHETSSSFSLTNAMCFSCSRADERRCGLGGKAKAKPWENICLKRRKEDFREALHLFARPDQRGFIAAFASAAPSVWGKGSDTEKVAP